MDQVCGRVGVCNRFWTGLDVGQKRINIPGHERRGEFEGLEADGGRILGCNSPKASGG